MGPLTSDRAPAEERPPMLTMKERAKQARRDAYVAAKEHRKNDPRMAELKAKMKVARREANAKAKELRKNDPKQIALKAQLKQDRKAASALAKDQRRTCSVEAKRVERADKDEHPPLRIVVANRGAMHDGEALPNDRARSLTLLRAALTVIEGGKSPKAPA